MKQRAIMVWGCSSGAGKSLIATALCRWAARRGIDVAPFKAQNMSNNARVVAAPRCGFGEIGAAQYFQALAARVEPTIDMNPVLLKPERDTASQVVLHGEVATSLSRMPWRERSAQLRAAAQQSFARLRAAHELLVIEGAGSPAEINLAPQDYVNLDTARWARDAGSLRSLLVADIDRGGAFAHLHGTWALLPDDLKPTLRGFVLNKFRGDATLLAPGPTDLQRLTGVPTVATLPMHRDHGLPDEDGVFDHTPSAVAAGGAEPRTVAIVAYPHVSNLDEFQPLRQVPGLRLVWARSVADLHGAHWIVLPGSKQVSGDLTWLRRQGLDRMLRLHAAAGRPLLGVCGGLQMLGQTLSDPDGVDGEPGHWPGLGLLPLVTRYQAPKRVERTRARFSGTGGHWGALAGASLCGYQIRHGVTEPVSDAATQAVLHDAEGRPLAWQAGPVLATAVHGLFESGTVLRALFGAQVRSLDDTFDGLADLIETHFAPGALGELLTSV
ncbi:cobyric acid synthase [Ideonella sp. DXS29W]|uniref:Cobyric acid synthase n=1 Tax=Ideonella lacteola TaxID=2984193 RepID=A0ABU9BN28_9BURK